MKWWNRLKLNCEKISDNYRPLNPKSSCSGSEDGNLGMNISEVDVGGNERHE